MSVIITAMDSPLAPWPLRVEDGSVATHMWNVGADYERARRRVLTSEAVRVHEVEKHSYPHHPLWVHRAVLAAQEERVFYRQVPLADRDRGLVYSVLEAGSVVTYRQIVERLGGALGRRQTRRALRSLQSRGVVQSEKRGLARFFVGISPANPEQEETEND